MYSEYEQLEDLLAKHSTLSFTMGSISNYTQTQATVTESIIIQQQVQGIVEVLATIAAAIKSYGELEPTEENVLESLLGLDTLHETD